jgi:hypothetical protein
MRKWFVALITFVGGAFFLLEFLLPAKVWTPRGPIDNPFTLQLGLATDIIVILTTMALLLGPINLVLSNGKTLLRGRKGGLESAVFLVFLVGGLVLASMKELNTSQYATMLYNQLFYGLMTAFGQTSMALLAFYLVSAAYRSFRLKSLDSAVMMISATVVLLGLTPIGAWLTHRLPDAVQWACWRLGVLADAPEVVHTLKRAVELPAWAIWLLGVPNTAVQRAVAIGACAGAFAAGLRHWLSIGTKGA